MQTARIRWRRRHRTGVNVTPFTLSSGSQFRQGWPGPGNSGRYAEPAGGGPLYAHAVQRRSRTLRPGMTSAAPGRTTRKRRRGSGPTTSTTHTSHRGRCSSTPRPSRGHSRPPRRPVMPTEFFDNVVAAGHPGLTAVRGGLTRAGRRRDRGVGSGSTYASIDLWRPVTAIQQADTDGNAGTEQDEYWLPLVGHHRRERSPSQPVLPGVGLRATRPSVARGAGVMEERVRAYVASQGPAPPRTLTTEDPHSLRRASTPANASWVRQLRHARGAGTPNKPHLPRCALSRGRRWRSRRRGVHVAEYVHRPPSSAGPRRAPAWTCATHDPVADRSSGARGGLGVFSRARRRIS